MAKCDLQDCVGGGDREKLYKRGEKAYKLLLKLRPLIISFTGFGVVFTFFVYTMYSSGGYVPPNRIHTASAKADDKEESVAGTQPENTTRKQDLLISSAFEVTGLGNLMFQYAAMIGIARHSHREAVVPQTLRLLNYFQLSATVGGSARPGREWPKILEEKANSFDSVVYETPVNSPKNVELVGYHQSWYYFRDSIPEIRKEFLFKQGIVDEANAWMLKTFNVLNKKNKLPRDIKQLTFVGVHIRRGDMTRRDFRDFGYTVADDDYLGRAMTYFRRKYTDCVFVFASDDIAWTKRHFRSTTEHTVVFSEGHRDVVDLAVLSLCNHVITTTGTFSWWAGFLSGGEATYYKNFPRVGSRLERGFSKNRTDYFYPGWVGL